MSPYRKAGKRLFDIGASVFGLIVLSPALAATAICVRLFLGRPVIFSQERPGLDGRPFKLLKFRTMSDARGSDGALLPDGERLGAFGRFLRETSLDELPELWNVLQGEMSIVGPRPLLMTYLPLYSSTQLRRHEVRPGITGWAQVNGRNTLSWEKKFDLDIWYVDNVSLVLDARILWATLRAVVLREGISAPGHTTMPPFTGSGSC